MVLINLGIAENRLTEIGCIDFICVAMYKVLLLCKNDALFCPLAEAYFKEFAGNVVEVYCAGVRKKSMEPFVAEVMREDGLEVGRRDQHQIEDFRHIDFDYILTFDGPSEQASHYFPSRPVKYHFEFDTLLAENLKGKTRSEAFRKIRDMLKRTIRTFVKEHFEQSARD